MNHRPTHITHYRAQTALSILTVFALLGGMLAFPQARPAQAAGGVTVSPVSGPTSEAGGTATFTVVLDNNPSDPVSIPLYSADLGEGTVSPTTLDFDNTNWNDPQTVTVTGVNDFVDDGDITYTIVLSNSLSLDPDYDDQPVDDVSVTNQDDDTAEVHLVESLGNTAVTEAGATDSYTLVLMSQPTTIVTVTFNSGAQVQSINPITFTTGNWGTPQTITVTAVDDAVDETSPHSGSVAHTVSSTDPVYNNIAAPSVSVSIIDNDTAGMTLTESGGSTAVTEGGATDSYTLVLQSQPTAGVVVSFNTGTQLNPIGSITFTDSNWDSPQTITVSAVDDFVDEDAHNGSIVHTVTSGDPNYNNYALASVSAGISDNDTAAFIVSPTSGLTTTEDLDADYFSVRLASQPEQVVVVNTLSLDTGEGTASPAAIIFSPETWSTPVTITVSGVNDLIDDGNITYTIQNTRTTADPKYSPLDPADVQAVNVDNDGPTLNISDASLTEGDSGSLTATFTVTLNQASVQTIRVDYDTVSGTAISPNDFTAISNQRLTFDPGILTRTIQVTVLGDTLDEDDIETYSVVLSGAHNAEIGDGFGQGSIQDNDPLPVLSITDSSVTETPGGATAGFVVDLTGSTDRTVSVDFATAPGTAVSPDDFTARSGSLHFAPGEHQKTINVTVLDDLRDEDDTETFSLTMTVPSTASLPDPLAAGTINDNDPPPSLMVSGDTVLEGNSGQIATASFTMTLSAESGRTVTLNAATLDGTAAEPQDYSNKSEQLSFAPGDTSKYFRVTVNGDVLDEDNETFNVNVSAVTNAAYVSQTITGTITDDDATPQVSIDDVTIIEGSGSNPVADFLVHLSETSGRTVRVTATTAENSAIEPEDYTYKTEQLVFLPGQTEKHFLVTIQGDYVDEDNETFRVNLTGLDNANSGDTRADGNITDDDTAALVTVPSSGLTTNEYELQAGFNVTLASKPLSNITVSISSSDTSEGTIVTPTLTFTTANWNMAQKSAVRGVADALDDGDIAYRVRLDPGGDVRYNALALTEITAVNRDKDARLYLPAALLGYTQPPVASFFDDFSTNKNWTTVITQLGGSALVGGGVYTLRHTGANLNVRSVAPITSQAASYQVEVTATPTTGSTDGARFGLLFDWLDEARFYRFVVDPAAGTWQVQKFAVTYQVVMSGNLPGNFSVPAHLKVERDALNIRAYINGQLVGEVQDTTYANGKAGVIMIAPLILTSGGYGEVAFDDFTLTPLGYTYRSQFSNTGLEQGWAVTASQPYSFTIESAALTVQHFTPNQNVRAVSPLAARTSPYSVSVQTGLAAGADTGTRYGILFGWLDSARFYRFVVDPASNQYLLQKFAGTYQTLRSGSLPAGFSAAGATLMIKRSGSLVEYYINGLKLGSATDSTYLDGKAGVIMIAPADLLESETAAAVFDDFTIGPLP